MEYGSLPGDDQLISRILQGCMMLKEDEQEQGFILLDAVVAQGINGFDHAHGYGGGQCERVFGRWLTARGNRDAVFILDKGCHPHRGVNRVTPECMRADIEESRARLGVETIDLWMFHRDDPAQPVEPLAREAQARIHAGHIRAWGGSNWTTGRIAEMHACCTALGLTPMVASSPNFSLAEQIASPWGPDCITISGPAHAEDRAWYRARGLPVFTWSSLARGFLSGRLTRENFASAKDAFEEHTIRCYVCEDNWRRLDRVQTLAVAKGLSVPQISLAWVLSQDLPLFALVAAYNEAEAAANAAVAGVRLTPTECAWLDLASDREP